jgi:hypothetical protein
MRESELKRGCDVGTSPPTGRILLILCAAIVLPVGLWKLSDDVINPPILVAALVMYSIIVLSVMTVLSHRRVTLLDPLLYIACTYYIPACIGAVNLGFTRKQPLYEPLLPQYEHSMVIAFVYFALGYVSLWIGFRLCKAKNARRIARRMPHWNWTPQSVILPALILLAVGDFFRFEAFSSGVIGYTNTTTEYGETLFSVAGLGTIGAFYLCWSIFSARRKTAIHLALALIVLAHSMYFVLTSGGKGAPITLVILIMLAYYASGLHLGPRGVFIAAAIAAVAIIGGVAYGSGFRQLLGGEREATLTEYIDTAQGTVTQLGNMDVQDTLQTTLRLFLSRCDRTSALAVLIARHDELKGAEANYGINDNILRDTATSIIPRFIWKDKPTVADGRILTQLYINVYDTTNTFGFVGDLFRNAGAVGVVIGMALLGSVLKLGYTTLVTNSESIWARSTYCILLTSSFNFEGLYSGILPALIHSALICVVAGVFTEFVVGRRRRNYASSTMK